MGTDQKRQKPCHLGKVKRKNDICGILQRNLDKTRKLLYHITRGKGKPQVAFPLPLCLFPRRVCRKTRPKER